MRRFIIFLFFCLIAIGIGVFLWWALLKPSPKPLTLEKPPSSETPQAFPVANQAPLRQGVEPALGKEEGMASLSNGLSSLLPASNFKTQPSSAAVQIKTLAEGIVVAPTLASDGKGIVFWDIKDSRFWVASADATRRLFSPKEFFRVINAIFTPDQSGAIIEYPDGAKIFYNFSKNTQTTLPPQWKDFSFSPDGLSIVFKTLGREIENRFLAIASPLGADFKTITSLGDKDKSVFPLWSPAGQIITMFTEHQGLERQDLFFLGANEEQYRKVALPGIGFKPLWSNKGDRLAFEVYSQETGFRPSLWVISARPENLGSARTDLNTFTFLKKCVWSADDKYLYCAIPRSLPEGSGLMPEAVEAFDDFWKIDSQTGSKISLASPQENVKIEKLFVSSDGNYLFFQGSEGRGLYSLEINLSSRKMLSR